MEVFAADEQSDVEIDPLRWVRLAEAVLAAEGVRGDAELSIRFVDEATIADLNRRFLDKEGPTDVLSFPIDDDLVEPGRWPDNGTTRPEGPDPEPPELPLLIGDVVICPAVAARNAPSHTGSLEDELALLVVHGILHLLGMDHVDDEEAEAMERREKELLARFHRPGPADEHR
ncbi:MAG: rRNA maturation RNase YbeY [Acidimicrobiia bacterium]